MISLFKKPKQISARPMHCNLSNGHSYQIWCDSISIEYLPSGKSNAVFYLEGRVSAVLCDISTVIEIEPEEEK